MAINNITPQHITHTPSLPNGNSVRLHVCASHIKIQCKPAIERIQALADISRSDYVVIATKPVHRLQIRPTVHNCRALPTIPQVTSKSVQ